MPLLYLLLDTYLVQSKCLVKKIFLGQMKYLDYPLWFVNSKNVETRLVFVVEYWIVFFYRETFFGPGFFTRNEILGKRTYKYAEDT